MANHIESLVEEIVVKLLQDTNIELIDVEYVKEKDWYLRVFIDKDGGIDEAFIKQLAAYNPLRLVFRDAGFASDAAKINVEQLLKQLSPTTDVKTI